MYAIEFKAKITDGMIQIPALYQKHLKDEVRVLVLMETPETGETFIDDLLRQPLEIPDFHPLSREDTHERC